MYVEFNCEKYNCSICTEHQKKFKGCNGNAQDILELNGEILKTCPKKIITEQTYYYLGLYTFYKEGFMINGPALLDQPPKYLQVIRFISSIFTEIHNENE